MSKSAIRISLIVFFTIVMCAFLGVLDYTVSQELATIATDQVNENTQAYKILKIQNAIHNATLIGYPLFTILCCGWVYLIAKKKI